MKEDAAKRNGNPVRDQAPFQLATARKHATSAFTETAQLHRDFVSAGPVVLQAIIDAYGSSVAILDKDQTTLYVNRAWRQFASRVGASGGHAVGVRYLLSGHPTAHMAKKDAAEIEAGIASVISKNEIEFRTEYRCTALPETQWFRIHAALFRIPDLDGGPLVLVSHEDITREKNAADLLVKDRQRLGRLLDSTKIVLWEADAESGKMTFVGEQAERMFGYPLEEWYQRDFKINHVHPDDRPRAMAEWARRSQGDDQFQCEYRMVAMDGRDIWINDIVSVHREHDKPASMSGFMIDITERKLADKTLVLLSGRLITAQEDERKRVARELHDDLNQQMASLSIELAQVGQMLSSEAKGAGERVKEIQRKAIKISEDIHQISYKLHPSKLDHLGLIPALRSFCSELAEHSGVMVNFKTMGPPELLSPDITLCLFRVAQEALQNSVKHSGALQIDITLETTENEVKLDVSDAGCGFDMKSGKMTEGLGFTSMAERLNLLGGFIDVRSRPLSGTRIEATVPLTFRPAAARAVTQRPDLRVARTS